MSSTVTLQTRTVDQAALARLKAAGHSPLMARLYAGRGIEGPDALAVELAHLHPPDQLEGTDAAASLLADAIASGRRMLVVGDYDCDGATGAAVAVLGLRAMGAIVDYLVPNRFEHGYGLSPDIVELARSHPRLGCPELLITVDNGISSLEGVAHARACGMQVLITDHHLPGPQLPQATVLVNPNLQGSRFPSRHLAGVGVMFYVLLALRAELRRRGRFAGRTEPALGDLLDLVALGTVADVVRLDANNRRLVAAGLKRLRGGRARPGLIALLQAAGRDPRRAVSSDLGFAAGPRINAAGRLADITMGIECLLTDDHAEAQRMAEALDAMNRERRDIEADMSEQALAEVGTPDPQRRTLVAFGASWHQGVIGLVASRLKERFGRPVLALARDDRQPGQLKGSGRSIEGVHLRDAIDLADRRAPGALIRFGGHAMAAGLTLHEAQLEAFTEALESAVRTLADPDCFARSILTDGSLQSGEFSLETLARLEDQVWGAGFPEPLFADRFDVHSQRLVKERHLKVDLRLDGRRLSAIMFGRTEPLAARALLAYQLQRDSWQGRDGLSLKLLHVGADPD
jgi:single-stranded-DNA-specific exonuclease